MAEVLIDFEASPSPVDQRERRKSRAASPTLAPRDPSSHLNGRVEALDRALKARQEAAAKPGELGLLSPQAFRSELRQLKARLRRYAAVQRLFDLAVVIVTAPLVLAVLALATLAIAVEDRGPILFRQARVGRGGRVFEVLKLRTMRTDVTGHEFTAVGDQRITRVGRFLRPFRIDELPQVINVLRGEMSICGPRPEALSLAREYRKNLPGYALRYLVRPGITGWAQVTQGYAVGVDAVREKLARDLYFVRKASVWMDLRILALTIPTLLWQEGAR